MNLHPYSICVSKLESLFIEELALRRQVTNRRVAIKLLGAYMDL